MASPSPDADPPMSTNEFWAALTDREKTLVGQSLISFRSFDIENFFPSAVRLIYNSNPFRATFQPAGLNTHETVAPKTMQDSARPDTASAEVGRMDNSIEQSSTSGAPETTTRNARDGSKTPLTFRSSSLRFENGSTISGKSGTAKLSQEQDTVKCNSGTNKDSASVASANADQVMRRTTNSSLSKPSVIPSSNPFEIPATKQLVRSNPTRVPYAATKSSSHNTGLFGTSSTTTQNITGGSPLPVGNKLTGSRTTSEAFGLGGTRN